MYREEIKGVVGHIGFNYNAFVVPAVFQRYICKCKTNPRIEIRLLHWLYSQFNFTNRVRSFYIYDSTFHFQFYSFVYFMTFKFQKYVTSDCLGLTCQLQK